MRPARLLAAAALAAIGLVISLSVVTSAVAGVQPGYDTSSPAYTVIQTPGGSTLTLPLIPQSGDGIANSSAYGLFTLAQLAAFNGTTNDRVRVDPNATGVLRVTTGGATNATVAAAAAGPVVVKASAGRLARVVVTAAGTASETFYDNASSCSGTVIAITPATTSVGSVIDFQMPAAAGITACGGAGSPALTVSYS